MKNFSVTGLVLLLGMNLVSCYPSFKDKIPNGDSVPHPCKPNYMWGGVGHLNPKGGGARNQFGIDFEDAGNTWTKNLCQKDSDGDGRTNGEELGDPECTWQEGEVPKLTLGLTHPGLCDPFDSPTCKEKNDYIPCDLDDFKCDAINEISTKNVTIRFPETEVPNTETNYYCMVFELPQDGDYHIVATRPYIDNEEIMHHIIMTGSNEKYGPVQAELNKPFPCGMVNPECISILGGWTVGSSGLCPHKNNGFRIGKNGYKKAALQSVQTPSSIAIPVTEVHNSGYKDSSGITLYYTANRRPNDAAVIIIGQDYLEIPPGKQKITVDGWCHKECSSEVMTGPIYVTEAVNHMHYLGSEAYIEQFRNGTKIRDITKEKVYSYDSPTFYNFENPYEILPGDELKTTCVFKSVGKSLTTFQGDSTTDEMCYGFLTVYPATNVGLSYCLAWKSIPLCRYWYNKKHGGCDFNVFKNSSHPDMVKLRREVLTRCIPFGHCLEECKGYVKTLKATHPCLKDDIGHRMRLHYGETDFEMSRFFVALDSCDAEIEKDKCPCHPGGCNVGAASGVVVSFRSILSAFFMFWYALKM